MEKRYQIFISSTFSDLQKERKSVMEAILSLDCFPAGMEMFPASDDEQFEYIKTIIDESDYYILIIAGRYGSIATDGKSYTQKEYEYAKEKKIPILTFIKSDIESIPIKDTDQDPKKHRNLTKFVQAATSDKMARFWDDYKDLKYGVHDALSKAFKTHPRQGWVKDDDIDNKKLLQQIDQLRTINDELTEKIKKQEDECVQLRKQMFNSKRDIDKINIDDDLKISYFDKTDRSIKSSKINYKDIFMELATVTYDGFFTMNDFDDFVKASMNSIIDLNYDSFDIEIRSLLKLRIKLQKDNLFIISDDDYFLNITETGRALFENLIIKE